MDLVFVVPIAVLVNCFIGGAVCAALDTENNIFYNWYKQDPTPCRIFSFLILTFWPVMAYFMWKYKRGKK